MSNIIHVENLSKRYIIGHQHHKGKRTFREAISQNIAGFGSIFVHPFTKNISAHSPYEEFWALKDINFDVEKGDRIGIIGRNGAGKSTLLKVLSRITEPSTGKIVLKGRVASLLEVGTGFNSELTGRENIFLNGAILGMHHAEIKQKFDEIVNFSGVEKFLDTPVKRYSSGMYVRLAFAVAAHLEPEILIIDEVLAVGDAEFQKKCLGKMQDVSQKEGRTVLFVSHNISAIESLCNRVIVLDSGVKKYEGDSKPGIDFYLMKSKPVEEYVPLINRTDRIGNGKVRVSALNILDRNKCIVHQVLSGEAYVFNIEYINNSSEIIDRVIISIDIYDEKEHKWLLLRSNFNSVTYTLKPGNGTISCVLENFPLTIGKYFFSVFISYADTEILDYINHVCYFEVIGGDFFGTGSSGFPPGCKILTISKWL